MGKYAVHVVWEKKPGESFLDNKYSRQHNWSFDGGIDIVASSSPHIVPVPMSIEEAVDPEEAFIASLSSCHMLWFLSIAAERQFVVERYDDPAVGTLGKNAAGKLAMTEVVLNPRVKFSGEVPPSPAQVDEMHHVAHEKCFIANSVNTIVRIVQADTLEDK